MISEAKGYSNQVDYGARVYHPRIGRFLSVDPLQKNFAMFTPYQFASNSPIANVDLDIKEAKYFNVPIYETYHAQGKLIGQTSLKTKNESKSVHFSILPPSFKSSWILGNGTLTTYILVTSSLDKNGKEKSITSKASPSDSQISVDNLQSVVLS